MKRLKKDYSRVKHRWTGMVQACVMLLVSVLCFTACYNDDDIKSDISDLQGRVAALEAWQKSVNGDISSLQTIVTALQSKNFINSVTPIGGGNGYSITFSNGETITIKDGADGKDGIDGKTPDISVKQDADGVYYWTVNDKYLTDASGNKLRVSGEKGEKGDQGIAPQVRISNGNIWQLSTDGGKTWADMTDQSGNKVKATGEKGADGRSGSDGDSFFRDVKVEDSYVGFTLSNGTTFTVPRSNGISINFENNEELVANNGELYTWVTFTGLTESNYRAIYAQLLGEDGSPTSMLTRASSVKVELNTDSMYAGVSIKGLTKDAVLKMTVITTDNSEVSASVLVKYNKLEEVEIKPDEKGSYNISTPAQWNWLNDHFPDGNPNIRLSNDIDFNGEMIEPLGRSTPSGVVFSGTFDGNNYTVSNFVIREHTSKPEYTYETAGLFGMLLPNDAGSSIIHNLTISNGNVSGMRYVGVVSGYVEGQTISNVKVIDSEAHLAKPDHDYRKYIGGICGRACKNAKILSSHVTNSVIYYYVSTVYPFQYTFPDGLYNDDGNVVNIDSDYDTSTRFIQTN